MRRIAVLIVGAILLTACGDDGPSDEQVQDAVDNALSDAFDDVPPCDDLTVGVDMEPFRQGCKQGDDIAAALGYECNLSGDEIIYVAPDEDAGEIYYGVPGSEAQKGGDFFAFMESC